MEINSRMRNFYNKEPGDIRPKTMLMTPISYHLNHSTEKFDPYQNSQRVSEISNRRMMNIGSVVAQANMFGTAGQQAIPNNN